MPPDERDRALLYDMLDVAPLQPMWADRSREELLTDRTLQWSAARGFSIIGEAVWAHFRSNEGFPLRG